MPISSNVQRSQFHFPAVRLPGRARHGWLWAGWAICWRQKSSAARDPVRPKAANLECLLQLCPQHTAGTRKAEGFHCTEVQVPLSQAPELHLTIVSGLCQVGIFCNCWHGCPSSIYRHCVGEKWVFFSTGLLAKLRLVIWSRERSCTLGWQLFTFQSHSAQSPTSSVFLSCLTCSSWEPLLACPPLGKLLGTNSFWI